MTDAIVLSHIQTRALPPHRGAPGRRVQLSPDLGRTTVAVTVEAEGVRFPSGPLLRWAAIEEINAAENNCFLLQGDADDAVEKIVLFSELTHRVYSLMPTAGAPTMLISGLPMHRIKGTTPDRDTQEKIRALHPAGRVLDTATGLGYTAIAAAQTAEAVDTIELDPVALEVARLNPWSRELFTTPTIHQHIGDSAEVVAAFEAAAFSHILHDPPTLSLAGHLYGRAFYRELYRVLQPGGRLFHYVGDPASRSGRSTTGGVIERLREVGFTRVRRQARAFGVVARKAR